MGDDVKAKVISWVDEVLRKHNFENIEVKFPDFDGSGGYASEMIFVDVAAKQNGSDKQLHLIIKKGKDSKALQKEFNFNEPYINELNVYSKFLPYFKKFAEEKNTDIFDNIPHCFGTINEDNEYVLVLENLKQQGFKLHELEKPHNLNHAKLVLVGFAKWHAFWLALRDQKPSIFEEFVKCNSMSTGNKMLECFAESIKKSLCNIIEFYEKKKNKQLVEKLKSLAENIQEIMEATWYNKEEEYQVIRHGDSWNNNFLFHYNTKQNTPDKVCILDWQLSVVGSPVLDVVLYLFYCSSRKELEEWDNLLNLYYETLTKKITELGSDPSKCFPRNVFQKCVQKYVHFGIAGMPTMCKMGYLDDSHKDFDVTEVEKDGNLDALFEVEFKDAEGYFNRVDGILQLCVELGLI